MVLIIHNSSIRTDIMTCEITNNKLIRNVMKFCFVLICFVFLSLHFFNISSWKKTFFSISLFTSPPSRGIWKKYIILLLFSLKMLNLNRPPPIWTWFEWNYIGLGQIIGGIGSAFTTDFKKLSFKKIQWAIFEIIEAERVRFVKEWKFGSESFFL